VSEPEQERLSADDAAILALESAAIAGHTLKLIVLEPGRGPVDLERLRATVESRLDAEPRGRQRVEPAGPDRSASWIDDDSFEIDAHVRRRDGTEGLDTAGLWSVTGEIMSERLDHARPLWAMDLVGPLADGREAVVVRIHHAMADGISCIRFLGTVLWDAAPADALPEHAPARRAPRRSVAREALHLPGALARELGARASRSPFDRPIGPERELAFAAVPLADLKRIGAARPGHVTVNDVLLAALAGGLRAWLGDPGARGPRLRAKVPVSLHHRDEAAGELGNRDSFLNVDLPLSEPDPLVRLDRINAETSKRKRLGDAEELYDFFHALARVKHLASAAQHAARSPREFSLSISNVPGPRSPVSVAGRSVDRLCSVAEPADRHALRASAISCAGEVAIGLCTDPEAVPGVASVANAIEGAIAELREAAIG
jgi:hypothetical protein